MPDEDKDQKTSKIQESVDTLTPEEVAILRKALARVEWQLFESVIGRLKGVIMITAGILTVFGLASLATIRSAAVEAAANRLASDTGVRDQVVAEVTTKLERVNAVVKKSDDLNRQLDAEQARAMKMVATDLERVLAMVQQVEQDLADGKRVANARP